MIFNSIQLVGRTQQQLYFLRRLRKFGILPMILRNSFSCVVESMLISFITVLYGNTYAMDSKDLQKVVKTAVKIIRTPLPSLLSVYHHRIHRIATSLLKDPISL